MTPQSYATHRHHPYFSYAAFVLALLALVLVGLFSLGFDTLTLALFVMVATLFVLVSLTRRFTTRLQDRIIRLEMRIRLAEVLPARQQDQIAQLTTRQLIALRFASDEELPMLVDRAVRENLTGDAIKRQIRTWVADWERT